VKRTIGLTKRKDTADNTIMKCVTAISTALVVAYASLASAQRPVSTKPLAEVAKAEEARRQQVRKPARVITNSDLKPDTSRGAAPPPTITPVTGATASPENATPEAPAADAEPAKGQVYWSNRIKSAREQLQRMQILSDSVQSRINALTTDFVNRDDPAQRAKIETDRQAALGELERLKKEMADKTKEITAIEDEARRAGVPPGWLRPGA
jgi:hypothetical protein